MPEKCIVNFTIANYIFHFPFSIIMHVNQCTHLDGARTASKRRCAAVSWTRSPWSLRRSNRCYHGLSIEHARFEALLELVQITLIPSQCALSPLNFFSPLERCARTRLTHENAGASLCHQTTMHSLLLRENLELDFNLWAQLNGNAVAAYSVFLILFPFFIKQNNSATVFYTQFQLLFLLGRLPLQWHLCRTSSESLLVIGQLRSLLFASCFSLKKSSAPSYRFKRVIALLNIQILNSKNKITYDPRQYYMVYQTIEVE